MEKFTHFFVRRWQFTLVLFGMLLSLGLGALQTIPKSEDPIVEFPGAVVVVVLPGADAEFMERVVAIPIEQAINAIEDVKEITSTSEANVASVRVEFNWGADAEEKYGEVVREFNRILPSLPSGIAQTRIERQNPARVNVVQLALVSETANIRQMEAYARELRDEIERGKGVQRAEIFGVPRAEVLVEPDIQKLAALGVPLSLVADVLEREGADIPLGALETTGRRLNIEATGPFDTLDEIRNVVLRSANGGILTVGDVADIRWSNDERLHITRYNGERALFVTAQGQLGVDVFSVVNSVKATVEAFHDRLPNDIRLVEGFQQSETVKERLSGLGRDFAIAILLVLLTLLPLGFRASLVVMIAIPLSISIGLLAIYHMGFSLNQLSIAGFVLSLGLLVDDSIVVVENITRHLRTGMRRRDAAIEGVKEINLAVVGCTAVLLFAFLPLMALPEATGAFIRSLPSAVTVTVLASLFVSLTIIPFLASRMLARKGGENHVLNALMGFIHGVYRPILRVALNRPLLTVLMGWLMFGASLTLTPKLGFSLFPENDSPYFVVDVELAKGASIEDTDRAVRFVDERLAQVENISWRFANTGRDNPTIFYNHVVRSERSNIGQIYARFDEWEPERDRPVLEALRTEFDAYPGARFNVRRFENGPPIEAPVAVRISGNDLNVLSDIAAEVEQIVVQTPGARNVVNPMSQRLITLDLDIDTNAAALAGVPAGAIDNTLRIAIGGAEVASFRDPVGDAYPVVLRGPRADVTQPRDLSRLFVWNAAGEPIPLSAISDPNLTSGPAQIDRRDRLRTVIVTAFNEPGVLTSKLTGDVNERLQGLTLPPGYTLSFGGEAEAQSESFSGLLPAILVASFGILAVLLLEFGSFAAAAIVAFVIPMGVMGGLLALYVGGESLSFVAMIGFIALTGIEIKNSILLVEFAEQERARGTPLREAIEKAGEVRFLPVLLTAFTAIGGLIPLVLDQSPLYSPLAMVIIGGLISSTLVARVVTPPLYLLLAPKDDPMAFPEDKEAAEAPAPAE